MKTDNKSKDLLFIFLINFALALLAYKLYIPKTFTGDTVFFASNPLSGTTNFLTSGRYVSYFIGYFLLKIGINTAHHTTVSIICGLFEYAAASTILFVVMRKYIKTQKKTFDILMNFVVQIVVVNVYVIEYIMFSEMTYLFGLAFVFAAIAIYFWAQKRYVLNAIFIILALCTYQSVVGIIIIWQLLCVYFDFEGHLSGKSFWLSVYAFVSSGLLGLLNSLSMHWLYEGGLIPGEMKSSIGIDWIANMQKVLRSIKSTFKNFDVLTSLNWLPLIYLVVIIFAIVFLLIKQQAKCLKYIYFALLVIAMLGGVYVASVGSTVCPTKPRVISSIFSLYSALFLISIWMANQGEDKRFVGVGNVLGLSFLIVQVLMINTLGAETQTVIALDTEYMFNIQHQIEKYAEETGTDITKIYACRDEHPEEGYDNVIKHKNSAINERIPFWGWGDVTLLNYITGSYYEKLTECDEEIYSQYFEGKDWDYYDSEEQLVFIGDTLYWCIY